MQRIGLVASSGFRVMSFAAASVFEFANMEMSEPVYDVRLLSETDGSVRTSLGMSVATEPFDDTNFDTLIVGRGTEPPTSGVVEFVRQAPGRCRRVAATCVGAFSRHRRSGETRARRPPEQRSRSTPMARNSDAGNSCRNGFQVRVWRHLARCRMPASGHGPACQSLPITGPLNGPVADTLNRTVRSLFTSPERRFFKPGPLLAPSNPLNYRAFNIRTKMAVVRLLRRKWAERDRKRPEMGLAAAARGSDKWPEKPTFCGFPTADQERKKNVPTGRLGGGRGTVVEPSLREISKT